MPKKLHFFWYWCYCSHTLRDSVSWVVLIVTHRETASCFTKICKVSRNRQCSLLYTKDFITLVKHYNEKIFCLNKISLCVFFIFHFDNSQRIFYHFLVSTNKMLSKSNTFIRIRIFLLKVKPLYVTFFV